MKDDDVDKRDMVGANRLAKDDGDVKLEKSVIGFFLVEDTDR